MLYAIQNSVHPLLWSLVFTLLLLTISPLNIRCYVIKFPEYSILDSNCFLVKWLLPCIRTPIRKWRDVFQFPKVCVPHLCFTYSMAKESWFFYLSHAHGHFVLWLPFTVAFMFLAIFMFVSFCHHVTQYCIWSFKPLFN